MELEAEKAQALVVCPEVQITLSSYRLDRFLGDGSLPHLVLGRVAQDIADCQQDLDALFNAGRPDWFESAGGARWFDRQGDQLRLRDDLYFTSSWTILDEDLRLGFHDRASRSHWSIPLDAGSISVLGALLPALRPTTSIAELRSLLGEEAWPVVEVLEAKGTLTRVPVVQSLRRRWNRLSLIGHSCLLAESPSTRVLIDPLLTVRNRPDLHLGHVVAEPLDAIVISHPHWDHCNLDTLLLIDRNTPVLVPETHHPASIVNVDIAGLCRQLGFVHVEPLGPWARRGIGDIEVQALPYFGEGSGVEGHQDWMTYLLSYGARTVVGFVDACHDSFGSMDDVARRIRAERGSIDLLFAPVSDFWFRTARYHRRPFMMGTQTEQFTGSARDARRWVHEAKARHVVPYAMFTYDQGVGGPFLSEQRGRMSDAIGLLDRTSPRRVLQLLPGDVLYWSHEGPLHLDRCPTSPQ
jgi:L-ascorbate metabolism protein UlaG (beta-lactamase superfamily)